MLFNFSHLLLSYSNVCEGTTSFEGGQDFSLNTQVISRAYVNLESLASPRSSDLFGSLSLQQIWEKKLPR